MTTSELLLLAAVMVPTLLGVAVIWRTPRRPVVRLAPWAPLPALACAMVTGPATAVELPLLLPGMGLRLDGPGAIYLGFTALLWVLAGLYARTYLAGTRRGGRFTALWLATLAGNIGLIAAADVVTFYMAFSVMTLASFGLVIHDETAAAHRAGRVYIVLAILGETALLLGFMLAVTAADDLRVAVVAAGIAASPWPDLTLALLVAGFGVKAGLVPLHVWLPLAHPAAPTPASAVLSGAIIKAGILGLLRFLPLDAALPDWGAALTGAGLFTAWYGILAGLPQHNPKTVLAYSSLSQMGLVLAGMGAALAMPGGMTEAAPAVALYSANHGLVKGALFLGVGIAAATGSARARPVFALLALAGLSVAGLPPTGGALAKLALKHLLGKGLAETLATLSAIGTTLLMVRFLWTLRGHLADDAKAIAPAGLLVPWIVLLASAAVVPWTLWLGPLGGTVAEALAPATVWGGLWAPLLGIALGAAAIRLRRPLPPVPEGDLVVPAERILSTLRRGLDRLSLPPRLPGPGRAAAVLGFGAERLDTTLRRWPVAGCTALAVAAALALGFAAG